MLGLGLALRAEPKKRAPFATAVAPFLEEHCLDCHTGKRAKAKLDLARFSDDAAVKADADVWWRVHERLRRREMPPPEDRESPTDAEYRGVLSWLEAVLPDGAGDPGRVTLRRLNRVEYRNTIRDLLGVEFDTTTNFPADDVGHGFDNIGDVLSLPPLLMEKYLAAAQEIAARTILDADAATPPVRKIKATSLRFASNGKAVRGSVGSIYPPDGLYADVALPRDGEYLLRARAYGDQAGPDVVRMAFVVGRKRIKTVMVPNVKKDPRTYEVRARIPGGTQRIRVDFVNDFYNPRDPNPNERDRNLHILGLEVEGPLDVQALPASHRRIIPEPAPSLRAIVETVAPRAWRRPVTKREVDRILRVVERAAPTARFERRVRIALVALLVSPHFLFRLEIDAKPDDPDAVRSLNDYEIASRLSYFLWSSMPDDELFRLAANSELNGRDVLDAQVRRMLRDARASALATNFASQWLQIRALDQIAPDPKRYPQFDAALEEAMRLESELFFEAILREDRPVWELLRADFSFLNERLARHYGVPGVSGARMRRVPLSGTRRGGILTHGSVLAVTSSPLRTSPVRRGKWILEVILDAAPPPPPPGLDQFDESPEAVEGASLRERLEQHRADPKCAVCHARMDSLGFALENFDAIGRWRERDGRFAVDASAKLPDGRAFEGVDGLRKLLDKDEAFPRSLSRHMLTYALGRGLNRSDRKAVDRLVGALEKEPTLSRLIREIVRLDAFRKRRGDGGRE